MAFRSSATNTGTSTAPSVAVPSGAAADDIAVVDVYLFANTTDSDATIIAAAVSAGFSSDTIAVVGSLGTGTRGRLFTFWKRLTGADAGSYTFAQTVSVQWEVHARLYSGRVKVGLPWNASPSPFTGGGSTSTTAAIPTMTPGSATADIVAAAAVAEVGTWTPPSGYTERTDDGLYLSTFDVVPAASAGATGTATATTTASNFTRAYQVALAADDHVDDRSTTTQAFAATTAQTVTLPTHVTGDRITICLLGKHDTATIPTISAGWTLAGSGTGGTGTAGTADVGPMFWAIYQKDAASSSETNPTITPGGTAPNTWLAITKVHTPSTGKAWRDAIATSAGYVVAVSDTDTATPLTGTPSAFSGQPTDGDLIQAFGAVPTDASSVFSASTLSATGLSDGTPGSNVDVASYARNSLGTDMVAGAASWTEFVGTASSGVALSLTFNSGNHSGVLIAVALRQTTGPITGTSAVAPSVAVATTGAGQGSVAVTPSVAVASSSSTLGASAVTAAVTIATTGALIFTGTSAIEPSVSIETTGALGVPGTVDVAPDVAIATTGSALGTSAVAPSVAIATTGTLTGTSAVAPVVSLATTGSALGTSTVTVTAAISTTGALVFTGTSAVAPSVAIATTGVLTEPPVETDTSNGDDGIFLGDGYAEVFFDPGVTPIPAHLALSNHYTIARVIDTPPVWTGARYDLAGARTAGIACAIDRVLIDDVDWTFFRGAAVVVEGVKLIDPLLYGNARITIPAINPQFPDAELGDLVELFQFARVRVQRVVAGVVIATDHKGFVSRVDTSGASLALEVGGQAAGALSQMYVPQSVYRRKQDVEHICVDLLRDARVRAKEHDGVSGIGLIKRSGADGLSIFNEYVAIWSGAAGQSVTFTPNADGVYRKTQKAGDEDPVDATAYIDNSLVTQSLAQDFMEQYTRVYAQGFTASGELVANIKTPGLTQGNTPAFPNGDDSPMSIGDTDADTDTGAGVTAVQQQLAIHDWLDIDDVTPGEFDLVTAFAVTNLQRWAGLNVTGEVGPNTWEALFDLPSIGYSLDEAREYPTAQDSRTFKWFRTANGSKIRENPDYDPHFIPNDLFISVGGPHSKAQVEAFAESKIVPEGGVWNGTLTFRSGLIIGDHSPGDPLTTADVMDRRDLLPNMRVKLPYFAGGIVVYLAGVDHGPDETTCLASTSPMTTMESWQAIERRREAQSNPGRSWSGHTRASQVRNDLGVSWDTSSGWIGNKVALAAGWNEIKVPAGQEGIVKEVRIQLEDAAEFACLLTQRPVSTDALDSNPHTGTPLTDPRPSDRPWWEKESVVAWLKARGYLNAWGTEAQPCGYDPSLKTDELGATAEPITGLFNEEAGFNYATDVEPVLYLYIWVGTDNALMTGRILRNLRTTDF